MEGRAQTISTIVIAVLLLVIALTNPVAASAATLRRVSPDAFAPKTWVSQQRLEGSQAISVPAHVEEFVPEAEIASFETFDARWRPIGETTWRVVSGTGNCCENYLASTKEGTIYDFGGDYLKFSADKGASWSVVKPADPLPNYGEGAVAVAPNGDVVGTAWNPYWGDRVVPFKYEAATEQWSYTITKLHNPFFDRPTIAVIPGPFRIGSAEFPYISILRGGIPPKTPWLYSLDGLNYLVPKENRTDENLDVTGGSSGTLDVAANADLDWMQPQEGIGLAPLGAGTALTTKPDWGPSLRNSTFGLFDPNTLMWRGFDFKTKMDPGGKLRADSNGDLHYIRKYKSGFIYRLSRDGGTTWTSRVVDLPEQMTLEYLDYRVSGDLELALIGIHVRDASAHADRDFVLRFTTDTRRPRLQRIYGLGSGNLLFGTGLLADGPRFDFSTIAMLPDGRAVASFGDAAHPEPALAIQIDS